MGASVAPVSLKSLGGGSAWLDWIEKESVMFELTEAHCCVQNGSQAQTYAPARSLLCCDRVTGVARAPTRASRLVFRV